MKEKNGRFKDLGLIFFFFRYLLFAVAATLAVLILLALVYLFMDISKNNLEITALVLSVIVGLVVSFFAGKESASSLTGGVVVFLYALLRCIVAVATGNAPLFSIRTPFELVTGFLVGIIGGIMGAGRDSSRRHRYR